MSYAFVLDLVKRGAKANFPKFKGEIIISRFMFLCPLQDKTY